LTAIVLSPRARADLDAIWDYTEQRWDTAQAEHYLRQLWRGIEDVAADPRRGTACDDIRPGYRKVSVGAHVVFYKMTPSGIDVVRVLHGRMDFGRHV
jgi:toxin ParE1/3/4